jgi:hypothetical protein
MKKNIGSLYRNEIPFTNPIWNYVDQIEIHECVSVKPFPEINFLIHIRSNGFGDGTGHLDGSFYPDQSNGCGYSTSMGFYSGDGESNAMLFRTHCGGGESTLESNVKYLQNGTSFV